MEGTAESSPQPAELREVAVSVANIVNQVVEAVVPEVVGLIRPKLGLHGNVSLAPPPDWASHLTDHRHVLRWDRNQTVATIGMGGSVTLGVVDTGSCKTIISSSMCRGMGIPYTGAKAGDCG
jgi:hypothetical protein